MTIKKLGLLLLTLVLSAMGMIAEAASVHLSVSMPRGSRNIAVGSVFYINYEVRDLNTSVQKPASVPGAKVLYFDRTGQSSSFTSVNGVTSQSFSYTYTLTLKAEKEGSFSFGPVQVGNVKSNQVRYTIGKADTQQRNQPSGQHTTQQGNSSAPKFIGKGDGNLFLRAAVSRTNAYEQEALVYTVKLYTTYDQIKFVGATSAPKFEGFVVEESKDVSTQLSFETYQGKTYATAIIARYIIFPQMKGSLKVIGNTYTVSVDQREYYHDPFWGNMSVSSPLQLNVTPNDLIVNVRQLPQPQPSDFSGGVGKFNITSSLPRTNFLTNQGASVIYKVTGTGNLKYLKLPDLSTIFPQQIEVYSPETDVKASVGKSNVSGTATFDYSFMPLEEGDFRIPEVTLCYFNPETGQYERKTARGFNIHVGKGKASDKSQTRDRLVLRKELKKVGKLSQTHPQYIYIWPYWMLYLVLVILLGLAITVRRKKLNDLADIEGLRSRKAGKIAQKRLKKAAACMKSGNTDLFYDEMLSALWGYMAHKLKMPTSELTRDNIRERLENSKVPGSLIDKSIELLDDCEFAKYAPAGKKENMRQIYDDGVVVINGFESYFKQNKLDSRKETAPQSISEKLDKAFAEMPENIKDDSNKSDNI